MKGRLYTQGWTRDQKDHYDGKEDALLVLAGKMPLKGLNEVVTPAYRAGWMETLETMGVAV